VQKFKASVSEPKEALSKECRRAPKSLVRPRRAKEASV